MGSFFSGTDDRDDLNAIGFSGVVGKLKDKEPEVKIRFNYYKQKYEVKLQDIFHTPADRVVDVPEEWLNNVNVTTYGSYGGKHGTHQGGRKWDHLEQYQYGRPRPNAHTPSGERAGPGLRSLPNRALNSSADEMYEGYEGGLPAGFPSGAQGKLPLGPAGSRNEINEQTNGHSRTQLEGDNVDGFNNYGEVEEGDPVGRFHGSDIGNVDSDQYAYLAIQYGNEVANAFTLLNDCMAPLVGKNELLSEAISDLFQLMEDEKQLDMIKDLFGSLPLKYQQKVAENGM
jgi:hypothetical protein